MPDGNICMPPYYDMNKAEDEQGSHIIIITSATNSVTLQNLEPHNFLLWQ